MRTIGENIRKLAILAACGATVGCQTTEQMAPPVTPGFVATLADANMETARLQQGRHTYVTQCARCHNIEPIGRYSDDRWQQIVDSMSVKARLRTDQKSDLLAYILAARKIIDNETTARTKMD